MKTKSLFVAILISIGVSAKSDPVKLYPMGEEQEATKATPVTRIIDFTANEENQKQQLGEGLTDETSGEIPEEIPVELRRAMREHGRQPANSSYNVLDDESTFSSK